jgi:hypothetical protein
MLQKLGVKIKNTNQKVGYDNEENCYEITHLV